VSLEALAYGTKAFHCKHNHRDAHHVRMLVFRFINIYTIPKNY
jgi:hypothetical protein